MRKIKYGIIGFGKAGTTHARVIKNKVSEIAELVAVCDIEIEKLKRAKHLYNVDVYENYETMIESGNVEALSICTPHHLHGPMCIKSIQMNINVLCEKPLATNISDAKKIIRNISKKNNVVAGIVLQHRFEKVNQLIKNSIDNGEFGKLISTSIKVKWEKENNYYDDWHGSYELSGGGVLLTQAIHMIDLASWFNNGVKKVYGKFKTVRSNINVEDNAIGIFEYNNGAFGVLDCTTIAKPGFGSEIEIVGTKSSVKIHDGKIVLWGNKEDNVIKKVNREISIIDSQTWGEKYYGYGHIFLIEDFIKSIQNQKNPKLKLENGLIPLKIIIGLQQSANTGKEIYIDEL